jgi:hypothetical protein
MDTLDTRLAERLARLEASLPPPHPQGIARDRGPARLVWVALAVALIMAFGGGVAARELVLDRGWTDSGLFTRGGALYCSGLQHMAPRDAAPILRQLGYVVTWQVDDRATGESYQSSEPPAGGYVDEGIQKGKQMIIVAPQNDPGPIPPLSCKQ